MASLFLLFTLRLQHSEKNLQFYPKNKILLHMIFRVTHLHFAINMHNEVSCAHKLTLRALQHKKKYPREKLAVHRVSGEIYIKRAIFTNAR